MLKNRKDNKFAERELSANSSSTDESDQASHIDSVDHLKNPGIKEPETKNDSALRQIVMTIAVQSAFPLFFSLSLYFDNMLILLWVLYVGFPLLDLVLPKDNYNPTPSEAKALEKDQRFLIPLYFTFFSDFILYTYSLWLVSSDENFQGVIKFTLLALMIA